MLRALSVLESTDDGAAASADAGANAAEEQHVQSRLSLAGSAALDICVRGAHPRADEGARQRRVPADPASVLLNGLLLPRRPRGDSGQV